jgi:hypothetical protein
VSVKRYEMRIEKNSELHRQQILARPEERKRKKNI